MPRLLPLGGLAIFMVALAVAPIAQPTAGRQVESVMTEDGPLSANLVVDGFNHPWGMAFLPDGRLFVTERNTGKLYVVARDGTRSDAIEGTPTVFAEGQGGLLDVALAPEFAENSHVYLSYAEPGPDGSAAAALGRGRWTGDRIEGFERIFLQKPWITGPNHFGGRIVFDGDGHILLPLGERFQFDPAQDLSNHLGKVVRLNLDGSVPDDNPFVGQDGAEPEIWSYGHRNVIAAALHPETGELWITEMGPLGGDELNQPEAGKNYGWPVVSWGINYDGSSIPDPTTRPDFADAVKYWSPVISPSGMIVYTGDAFADWRGNVFIGALSAHQLVRLEMGPDGVAHEERIPLGERFRDVEEGPDGSLYVLTDKDNGALWRISPMEVN